jgi:3',5'-cyclic AMP phosphodiesterase CpdA
LKRRGTLTILISLGDGYIFSIAMERREFLKWGAVNFFWPSALEKFLNSALNQQLWNEEYPFPYDAQYFECAERVFNVRRSHSDPKMWLANLNLIPKEGKKLNIKVLVSDREEGLSTTKNVQAFDNLQQSLNVYLTGFDSKRLYYQVLYREAGEKWKASAPRSFKLPNLDLEKGEEITVIFIADDHTFNDANIDVSEVYKNLRLSGDYVNEFLEELRFNPNWEPKELAGQLENGLNLARAIRYIVSHEEPDFIIHLGDTTGIGAGYDWKGLGLPYKNLTESDYDFIAKTLWMRMRKMYSSLTPSIPIYLVMGNHDGENSWRRARSAAKKWRKLLFPLPGNFTYPEGGHTDGDYYAFSWGSDPLNRGGAQFIILNVSAFSGDHAPKTPEEWTLGPDQLDWFENVLKKNEKHWRFACIHHVVGGWPAGENEAEKNYAYGRGPLFTFEDYVGLANPHQIEQVKITNIAEKHGLRAFFYGHDHIFHVKEIGERSNQKNIQGICCGSTKYRAEEHLWEGSFWRKYYGDGFKSPPDFWGPPGITKLIINKTNAKVEYLITGDYRESNLPLNAKIGNILYSGTLVNPPPSS